MSLYSDAIIVFEVLATTFYNFGDQSFPSSYPLSTDSVRSVYSLALRCLEGAGGAELSNQDN